MEIFFKFRNRLLCFLLITSSNLFRTVIYSSREKNRTILPNPKPSSNDSQRIPTPKPNLPHNEIPNKGCSGPLSEISIGVTTDNTKCAVLPSSEKENIQPIGEETVSENIDDCSTENPRRDTNEDIRVIILMYFVKKQ